MLRLSRPVLALFTLVAFWPAFALAQTKAGVVTTLQGSATAARTALPQPVALKFKDDVFQNDRIVTGDQSIVRMLLGGKAVVTVRERSSLTITEVPGKSTIDLDVGKIAVAVAREKLRPGESIEIKTPNAVAAVRGTAFVIEVIRATAALDAAQAGVTTNAYWFRGVGTLTIANQVFNMAAGLFFSGTGTQGATSNMTPQQQQNALSGVTPDPQNAAGGQDNAKNQALGTTVATFTQPGGGALAVVAAPTPPPPPVAPPQPVLLPGGGSQCPPTCQTTSTSSGVGLLSNSGFESGDFTGWTLTGAGAVIKQFGTLTPPEKSFFALLHTATGQTLAGCGTGNPCTRSTLSQSFNVNSVLTIKGGGWAISNEFPTFTGSKSVFNDHFLIQLVDASGTTFTLFEDRANDLHGKFNANSSSVTVGAFTLGSGAGITEFTLGSKTVVAAKGTATLKILIENISDAVQNSGLLFDDVVVTQDPPLFFILDGATFTRTESTPLLQLANESKTFDSLLMVCCNATATLAGPILEATNSALDVPFSLVSALQGGTITSTSTSPLVLLQGGTYSLGTNVAIFDIAGTNKAFDPSPQLTLGTDKPLRHGGVFLDASSAAIKTRSLMQVDTALLEATAPLLNLAAGASLTTTSNAVDLVGKAKLSIPNDAIAMINLSASSLTVMNGHLVNVAGGSSLNLAGSLVNLSNGSTLNILNGLLLNATGGSVANIGKSLVSFSGSGNLLNVTNNLVPTALIGGVPVYGPADSFKISGNALAGLGAAGAIKINGVALTPTTPLASIKGSLVAVQGNGAVKVGQ